MMTASMNWRIDPVQSLGKLSAGIRNKALRIALNSGAAPVKAALIAAAPADRGNLKKAIIIKVKNYKSNNTWCAIVGAGSKFKRVVRPKLKGYQPRVVRPARYQHLVDKGSKRQRGRHFISAAYRTAHKAFAANVKRKLTEQLNLLMGK